MLPLQSAHGLIDVASLCNDSYCTKYYRLSNRDRNHGCRLQIILTAPIRRQNCGAVSVVVYVGWIVSASVFTSR